MFLRQYKDLSVRSLFGTGTAGGWGHSGLTAGVHVLLSLNLTPPHLPRGVNLFLH